MAKCPRCGLKTRYMLNSHELFEFDVCSECIWELNAKVEEQEEEDERVKKEEESWEIEEG